MTIHLQGFGDGYYKLPKGLLGDAQHRKYIKTLSAIEKPGKIPLIDQYEPLFYGYKTPPYITARPETGSNTSSRSGDIAILATDGLWDLVSSEVAVQIVLHGAAHNEDHLAKYLLEQVIDLKQPHDDVTIIICSFSWLRFPQAREDQAVHYIWQTRARSYRTLSLHDSASVSFTLCVTIHLMGLNSKSTTVLACSSRREMRTNGDVRLWACLQQILYLKVFSTWSPDELESD
jgi:hypothetical protein